MLMERDASRQPFSLFTFRFSLYFFPVNLHEQGRRIALKSVLINLAMAAVKTTAGVFGNAYALIADGVESMLDAGSSLIVWSGLKVAERPPDEEHPYGHGKAEPIAGVVVARRAVLGDAFGVTVLDAASHGRG